MEYDLGHIFGERVFEALIARGYISKTDFCLMADISRPYLDLIEKGESNVSLDIIARLAAALEVEPSSLLEPYEDSDQDNGQNCSRHPL